MPKLKLSKITENIADIYRQKVSNTVIEATKNRITNDSLKLITQIPEDMRTHIGELLRKGESEGKSISATASTLLKTGLGKGVFKSARRRAYLIARTELHRSRQLAAVDLYKAAKIEMVKWVVVEDSRLCKPCKSKEKTYNIKDIEDNLPPEHPRCRCRVLPADYQLSIKVKKNKQDKVVETKISPTPKDYLYVVKLGKSLDVEATLEKARSHKYLRRTGVSGKYDYVYREDIRDRAEHFPSLATHVTLDDFKYGSEAAYSATTEAARVLFQEHAQHLHLEEIPDERTLWQKVKATIKKEVNIKEKFQGLVALGRKHGPWFMAYAIALEILEQIVVPAVLIHIGKPHLAPMMLAIHTEPVMYPLFFGIRRLMKKKVDLMKAMPHKYIKRTGVPGKYKYFYLEGKTVRAGGTELTGELEKERQKDQKHIVDKFLSGKFATPEAEARFLHGVEHGSVTEMPPIKGRLLKPEPELGIKTVGIGIGEEFKKKGFIDLRGQKVNSVNDVAELAQIYRNPQYETFRYIYVRNGVVVGHEGRSSRIPGQAGAFAKDRVKELYEIKRRIARLGADTVWLVHNHPSGNPTPSGDDLRLTGSLMKEIPQIKGHIVVNSQTFGFIERTGVAVDARVMMMPFLPAPKAMTPILDNPLLGQIVTTMNDVAKVATALKVPKTFATILYRAGTQVKAIQEIPLKMLTHYGATLDYLRGRSREFGARDILVALEDSPTSESNKIMKLYGNEVGKTLETLVGDSLILDAVYYDHTGKPLQSLREGLPLEEDREKWMGRPIHTYVTKSLEKGDFASTQVNLPKPIASKVEGLIKLIDPEDLHPTEKQDDDPHITVRYGLLPDVKFEDVKPIFNNEDKIEATILGVDIFQPEDKDYDVLVLRVDSPDLARFNRMLGNLPHEDTFPDYNPHSTIAYLKRDRGKKYADMVTGLEGETVEFSRVEFSTKDYEKRGIKLEKARSHKYIKRTGTPGHYRYDYFLPLPRDPEIAAVAVPLESKYNLRHFSNLSKDYSPDEIKAYVSKEIDTIREKIGFDGHQKLQIIVEDDIAVNEGAKALYDNSDITIKISKEYDNTLAHEYAHFIFDQELTPSGKDMESRIKSSSQMVAFNSRCREIFGGSLNEMVVPESTPVPFPQYHYKPKNLEIYFDKLDRELMQTAYTLNPRMVALRDLFNDLGKFYSNSSASELWSNNNYSVRKNLDYFLQPTEMFARAVDTYVNEKPGVASIDNFIGEYEDDSKRRLNEPMYYDVVKKWGDKYLKTGIIKSLLEKTLEKARGYTRFRHGKQEHVKGYTGKPRLHDLTPLDRIDKYLLDPTRPEVVKALNIAKNVQDVGGRALLVGGCVRDAILGRHSKDVDVEVYGVNPDRLSDLLESHGNIDRVGRSFGVFKVSSPELEEAVDVSIPRRESKSGKGHKGFMIEADPSMTIKDAASRRDLTINSMAFDPITKELFDPFNGIMDIKDRTLRATDPSTFGDDSLRVLRVMRFASQLGMTPDVKLAGICNQIDLTDLPKERIFGELSGMLLKAKHPSIGLQLIPILGIGKILPELVDLKGVEQEPDWHPEGDAWTHTLMVVDEAAKMRDRLPDPKERLIYMLGALCHDLGKPQTTEVKDGVIISHSHDSVGADVTRKFLGRLTDEEYIVEKVVTLVQHHMKPTFFLHDKVANSAIRRLSKKVDIPMLVMVSAADKAGRGEKKADLTAERWLMRKFRSLGLEHPETLDPRVRGRDLIPLGIEPGPEMGRILDKIYNAQLEGQFQTTEEGLEYAKQQGWLIPLSKSKLMIDMDSTRLILHRLQKSRRQIFKSNRFN